MQHCVIIVRVVFKTIDVTGKKKKKKKNLKNLDLVVAYSWSVFCALCFRGAR